MSAIPIRDRVCAQEGAHSMFPDDWPSTGRARRAARSRALRQCRECPARALCERETVEDHDGGLPLYGVRAGVVFGDVMRPEGKVAYLRMRAS